MLRNKLRRHDRCPVHHSFTCECHGELRPKKVRVKAPRATGNQVIRIPDEHHPRGYRERRGPVAMRRMLDVKILEQDGVCPLCESDFNSYFGVVLDHIVPKGIGGATHDDHTDNLQAVHSLGNLAKGSMSLELYLQKPLEERKRLCGVVSQQTA